MGWFNRYVIAQVAPRYALKREAALRAVKSYYEAAEESKYRKKKRSSTSANVGVQKSARDLRNQARYLDDNYDIASGILDVLCTNIVGGGVQPEPQIRRPDGTLFTELNQKLATRFGLWSWTCDVTGQLHLNTLQKLACRSWLRDGEVFAQKIIGNVSGLVHGDPTYQKLRVPYSIEALEADFVPEDFQDEQLKFIQGIQVNEWMRPTRYRVYKKHPGDTLSMFTRLTNTDTKDIEARNMMHLAFRKRFHQLRGVSIFAPSLTRLDDIKDIHDFERIAGKIAASMAAAIIKGEPASYEGEGDSTAETKERRELYMQPGLIFDDLKPGERVETIDTRRPNTNIVAFSDANLRAAASGVMASYSSISKNYNGTYSAQRQELVEQWPVYMTLQGEFIYRFNQPIWDGYIDAEVVQGELANDFKQADPLTIYDCSHTAPSMPWIDPLKEAEAKVLEMRWRVKARSKIIRESGQNPDVANLEMQRDDQERDRLDLDFIAEPSDPNSQENAGPTRNQEND